MTKIFNYGFIVSVISLDNMPNVPYFLLLIMTIVPAFLWVFSTVGRTNFTTVTRQTSPK